MSPTPTADSRTPRGARTPRATGRLTQPAIVVGVLVALLAAWLGNVQPAAGPLDPDDVVARARTWTDLGVPYNQLTYKGGYRMDCSGFVSMAWDLPENLTTWRIPLVAERVKKDDLRAGDVLLDHTSDNRHVVIFERWANAEKTRYIGLECTGQEGVMGAVRRQLPFPYRINEAHYKPWRFTGMERYWDEVPRSAWQPVEGYEGDVPRPVVD